MTEELRLAARIDALPGKGEELAGLLAALVDDTRGEEGCLRYDLYRDPSNPDTWIFVENWASHELWQQHVDGPRFKAFVKEIEGIARGGPYKLDPTRVR